MRNKKHRKLFGSFNEFQNVKIPKNIDKTIFQTDNSKIVPKQRKKVTIYDVFFTDILFQIF